MTTRWQSVFTVLLVFAGFSFFLTACQMTGATNGSSVGEPSEQKACEEPDNRTRVTGGGECLVIWTYDKSLNLQHPTLVVFLHGDKSRGGPVSWELRLTRNFADPGTVSVALIRPGYPDAFGGRSTGDNYGRRDSYTPHNIDAVAEAIGKLKDHHDATKLVLVGYSGGAAYTGVIIGRHPGLVDAALLIACPCNIHQWRSQQGRRPWKRSRSPHLYARRVPLTTRVIGEKKAQYEAAGFAIDVGASILGGGYYGQTAAAGSALSQLATYGVLYPFSRGMESEADIIGLEYMAMAGFDPRESAKLWQNMDAKKESKVPAYMTTHPSADTRIDDLVSHYPETLGLYNLAQAEGHYPDCQQ